VAPDDSVHFYVIPLEQQASATTIWLVCKGSPSNCVGVQADVIEAIAQAVRMANYQVLSGGMAQVHVRDAGATSWRTVWCPPGSTPHFR
jgi:hypothetical protein